jgi:hypothetical protein
MPQKRLFTRKSKKTKPDLELARLQRMAANPFHAVAMQHGMRVPVLKMFCTVFVELAGCSGWTKRPPVVKPADRNQQSFWYLCKSMQANDCTAREYVKCCRCLWSEYVEFDSDRDGRETTLLKKQIDEMHNAKASALVVNTGLALASGLHPRLGRDSPLAGLGADVVLMIMKMVRPAGMVLWVDVFAEYK